MTSCFIPIANVDCEDQWAVKLVSLVATMTAKHTVGYEQVLTHALDSQAERRKITASINIIASLALRNYSPRSLLWSAVAYYKHAINYPRCCYTLNAQQFV